MSATARPMYRKYYEAWKEQQEKYGSKVALLYQVGGFFEIYDTENLTTGRTQANIREIAELCQLSLTVHPVEQTFLKEKSVTSSPRAAEQIQTLFGGFPEHAVGKYERILVQAGFTVVVVTQKKGKAGKVEERVVDHISSPGCYVDSISIKERRLVGCVLESLADGPTALRRVYWSAVALDIATGRIWFVEGTDRDRLHQFLCVHPPSELVVWSDGLPAANAITESLKKSCDTVHLQCLPVSSVALEENILERFWQSCRKRLEWLATQPQSRRTLSLLLEFAADHVPSALKQIDVPVGWIPDGEVRLGNAALEQLGLLHIHSSGKGEGLLDMMDQCRSMAGKRLMRSRLLKPIYDIPELQRRLDYVDRVAVAAPENVAITERGLRSLYDISRLFRRVELGTITMEDMACLMRSYEAAQQLLLAWDDPAKLHEFVSWIFSRWNVVALVENSRDGHSVPLKVLPFVAGVYPETEKKFAKGVAIYQDAQALCAEWSKLGKGEPLYLDFAEGGGFRITGTKRRISSVHTVLRDSGDTSAVINTYKTSAVLENAMLQKLTDLHRKWYAEWVGDWSDAWFQVCQELIQHGKSQTVALEQWCAELDVAWTTAKIAREWLWKRPVFVENSEEGSIIATKLRHPILERIQTQMPYVTHSVGFCKGEAAVEEIVQTERGILLYGMNASGKSSLMKAIGLCVLLAQAGFPVPAATCQISPFTAIFTRILGNDNLWAGLSSFAVEMTEFREILRFSDERSLVLGDELCSGTESLSATALVAAGVETLVHRGSKFVFATHLHELATLPDIQQLRGVRAVHLRVHYDAANDLLIYDRQLAPGSGSALYGLEVCRALDLPTEYLQRAVALRKVLAGDVIQHVSAYSSTTVVEKCGVCSATGKDARLEVHHIRPQAEREKARTEGQDIDTDGNLVCLCWKCHDLHHAGTIQIHRWTETSEGRKLHWTSEDTPKKNRETHKAPVEEIEAWVRDQHRMKIRVPIIQRMLTQIFGVELSEKEIRSMVLKRFQNP